MVKNANIIKDKIIAAEKALFYLNQFNKGWDDQEYVDMIRGTLSEAMELLDENQ